MTLPDPVQLAVPAFVLLIIAEMAYGRATGRVAYETRDMTTSLIMGFGNLLAKTGFAFLAFWAYGAVYAFAPLKLGFSWWVFALCFVLEDFAYYWYHRISHERRWFWATHVVHHSSQHYNLSTALRQPWTGRVTFTFIFWLPLMLFGFDPAMVLFFSGVNLVYQFWIHTEAVDRLGPLELIFNTPSHHRVHHGTNPRYLDANYGGIFIIWDRIFGTFIAEVKQDPPRYGIIKRLGTFNPLRVAFHEWWDMIRDVIGAKSAVEAFKFVLGPPGWSPDGSRRTAAQLKADWYAAQKTAKEPVRATA